jgi:hypothetical protein
LKFLGEVWAAKKLFIFKFFWVGCFFYIFLTKFLNTLST